MQSHEANTHESDFTMEAQLILAARQNHSYLLQQRMQMGGFQISTTPKANCPGVNDVMCGRGGGTNNHIG
eukprot:CAMPEP_0194184656 /NCGR_PEP_ID=MMETSP0154-20130528/39039_1 /TAXON_ID=1049557 /ORGANISM="Thalassiothrix antarctica, Strain L6-D1" /LENGTH=69 /DNA_ID=CAMNT_0038902459 /DNA_START=19 /DNA_END=225 /DNA_ORIENTATION=+